MRQLSRLQRSEHQEILRAQTEVLKQAIGESNQGSITTAKTHLRWPTLSDENTDVRVTEFYKDI